ncbi:hypothetical protein GX408_10625 [bacterium]|nr:hypothetical protein [bacterium]
MKRFSHLTIFLLVGFSATNGYGQTMHPTFPLLDSRGGNVLKTSRPVHSGQTCGQCHDSRFISENSTKGHATQTEAPKTILNRLKQNSQPSRTLGEPDQDGMNCFLCHLAQPDNGARLQALASGQADWAATATLAASGIVHKSTDGWRFERSAFSDQDELLPDFAQMVDPQNHHCGFCHGQVHMLRSGPVLVEAGVPEQWSTFTTGQVFSPQRINESGINLANKESLSRPWDVHSERLLDCVACHFSINHPAHQQADADKQPGHLAYSPRRLDIKEYLNRPNHLLAGSSMQPSGRIPMRRCEGCHDFNKAHPWLPFRARHKQSLSCETCHIPQLYAPAAASIDLSTDQPRILYRGAENAGDVIHTLTTGYSPIILPRSTGDGVKKLAPFNLITTWKTHEQGQSQPLTGEVQPYSIHHNVAHGAFAVRECRSCHDQHSILSRTMFLSSPRSDAPAELWKGNEVIASGVMIRNQAGFYFTADPHQAGFYILGHSKAAWVQWLGGVVLVLTLIGILLHTALRIRSARKHRTTEEPTQLVFLYEAYERYWHWLQAIVIIGLILTGLTIHAPSRFAWLSFAGAVNLHNVLAALLLFNAFLSLFYHFASGKIRTYLPEPNDFFNQMFSQARYYLSGIFKGEPHPFEKSAQKKLNPLQKITYLVILNVLLPLQVITGILIAGAQIWPRLSQKLGGLGVLVPLHSLLAWFFAAFLILHIYLTTTGHTPLASIKAMISGWEKVALHPKKEN